MEGNKDESERCIEMAEVAMKLGHWDKAGKFLQKAQKLYPSDKAKALLEKLKTEPIRQQPTSDNKQENAAKDDLRRRKTDLNSKQSKDSSSSVQETVQYTEEQKQLVLKIQNCKDYYEILNIKKDATDSEIKKAYKKLALNLHPDKNPYPGAMEAFKTLGNAVTILTDPVKRKQYDNYGPETNLNNSNRFRNAHYEYFESETSPEEIFNMFFGSNLRNARARAHANAHARSHSHTHAQNRDAQPFSAFVQILPILLAIILSMASSFFISDPAYSLQQTQKYQIPRKTQNLQVPYYVKSDFYAEYQGSVKRLEILVEEEYLTGLRHACYREKNYRDSMIWKAKNFGDRELFQTAQNIRMPSCAQLNELRGHGV